MADFTPQPLQMAPTGAGMTGMIPFISPDQIAQNQSDMLQWQQKQALAQQLMGQQYIPNSGNVGLGGTILSKVMGALAQRGQNEKLTDILKQQFQIENSAAQAKRQQDLADEYRKLQEEVYKTQQGEKAKRDYAPLQFQASGAFDPSSGQYTPSAAAAQQEIGIKGAEADATARASAKYREAPGAGEIAGMQAKLALASKLGASPEQILAMVTGGGQNPDTQVVGNQLIDKRTGTAKPILGPDGQPMAPPQTPLTAEQRGKLALINNAIDNAKKYQGAVVGKDGSFDQIGSQTGATPELLNSAIQDMLYAKSGASAPTAEVQKAHEMYGPSRLGIPFTGAGIPVERGSTSADKVQNLISDLTKMRDTIGGGQGAPQTAPAADGGHRVGDVLTVKGKQYRVTGGDPTNPNLEPL